MRVLRLESEPTQSRVPFRWSEPIAASVSKEESEPSHWRVLSILSEPLEGRVPDR